jgi:hypothetical protein
LWRTTLTFTAYVRWFVDVCMHMHARTHAHTHTRTRTHARTRMALSRYIAYSCIRACKPVGMHASVLHL